MIIRIKAEMALLAIRMHEIDASEATIDEEFAKVELDLRSKFTNEVNALQAYQAESGGAAKAAANCNPCRATLDNNLEDFDYKIKLMLSELNRGEAEAIGRAARWIWSEASDHLHYLGRFPEGKSRSFALDSLFSDREKYRPLRALAAPHIEFMLDTCEEVEARIGGQPQAGRE
ncbi:hypothetical protein [Paraburkholderia sediminicola]|uniref:hypothetical protein n=1 Tax=Paraburkholderia sediminicola TaxID=458836 RepID=UPI0038BDD47E